MRKPISYWVAMTMSSILAAACLYLAYLTETAHARSGFWLFAAFGVLFLVPPIAMLVQSLREQPEAPAPSPETVFAPHWHVVSAGVIFLLIVLASVVAAITA